MIKVFSRKAYQLWIEPTRSAIVVWLSPADAKPFPRSGTLDFGYRECHAAGGGDYPFPVGFVRSSDHARTEQRPRCRAAEPHSGSRTGGSGALHPLLVPGLWLQSDTD